MKASFSGRWLFGISAIVYGIASLIWHDSGVWQSLHAWGLSGIPVFAWVLTIALMCGGIAILHPRTARAGAAVIAAFFGLFTLACLPQMVAAPRSPDAYINFFEQLSMVCGALAVCTPALVLPIRVAFGVCVASFAWAQVVYLQYTASLVPAWIPPNQVFWTNLTTAAFTLAAIAILIDRQAKLAMRLMALMLTLFGILVWVPKIVAHPAALSNWTEISSNYVMAAASLLVASLKRKR